MTISVRSGAQLGRSALLIHGLMWLSAGVYLGLSFQSSTITVNALGVPFAATLVLYVWSIMLATRAFRSAENTVWPVLVLVIGLLEIAVLFAWVVTQRDSVYVPVRWAYRFGLPVFVPALILSILLAAAIARWRTLRAERAATAGKGESWERRRRWKYGLRWFVPIALVLLSLLAPAPLYVYSLMNYTENQYDHREPFDDWVVCHTPVIVAEPTAAFFSGSTRPSWSLIYTLAISSGRVSRNRLMADMNSSDPWLQKDALDGLEKADVAAAVAQSEKIAHSATLGWVSEFSASRILGRHGGVEQVRPLLRAAETATSATQFMDLLLGELAENKRLEFIPDFVRLADSHSPYRDESLEVLARLEPSREPVTSDE